MKLYYLYERILGLTIHSNVSTYLCLTYNNFHMDNTTKYLIAAGAFLGLALVKSYFSGSTCRLRRELRGQVAIVTGGNTGIGR